MKRANSVRKVLNSARLTVLLCLVAFTSIVPACALQPKNCEREKVFCVGLVTAYEGVDDHGLNQAAWETLQAIQTQAGIARLDKIESVDTRDWLKNIYFFAENTYDVVVTVGRNLSETTVAVASEYSGITFIGIDQPSPLGEEYPNIATIYFDEGQAGFLAGALAAKITEANEVGAVCESNGIDAVWRYCEAFRAGVKFENEDIRALVIYRNSGSFSSTFNDPEWGQERATSLIDGGTDVLSGFGGNTAQGAFLRAAEKGIPIIGAEEDLYFLLPEVRPELVTSIINDPSETLAYLVLQASQGEILSGAYAGQITYTPFRGPNQRLENDAKAMLQGIRNGDLEIDLPERK